MDFEKMSIREVRSLLDTGELRVRELVDFYLENIKEKNDDLNIFLSVFDDIDEYVDKAQKKIDAGESRELTGIPFAVKSNIAIFGKNMTAASKTLENYIAPYDATVIKKLKKQGAVLLGYVNMDEFACGASGENSAYGNTKNPEAEGRVPGGSSAGSAAAVVANMAMVALGTDTGGSVRQPSAFCGVVGVKPTYGRVSRFGAVSMGSSLDQIAPITKNVADSLIVLKVISGPDGKDMNAFEGEIFDAKIEKKVAVPYSFLKDLDPELRKAFDEKIEVLKSLGYEVEDVDLNIFKYALSVYYILMPAELSTNLSRIDGIRYGSKVEGIDLKDDYFKSKANFGSEIKRRITLGTYILSEGYADAYYEKALTLREVIKGKFAEIIKDYDAVLFPTTPTPAFKFGENENPVDMYLADIFTVPANIIGCPAISIPMKKVFYEGQNLPFGIQVMAAHREEGVMAAVARDLEE